MSPNGRLLAYFTYRGRSGSVAVLDLVTGRVRSVNVDAAVGHGHVLAEIQPGWTRDSSMVVLATGSPIRPVSRSAHASANGFHPGAMPAVRLIVVSVTPKRPLTARRILVSGLRTTPDLLLASDAISRNSVVAASLGPRGNARLDQIHLTPTRAAACQILSIPDAQVLAFDPTGQRLIYIAGHSPAVLQRATIKHARLTDRRRLLPDRSLGAIAW